MHECIFFSENRDKNIFFVRITEKKQCQRVPIFTTEIPIRARACVCVLACVCVCPKKCFKTSQTIVISMCNLIILPVY